MLILKCRNKGSKNEVQSSYAKNSSSRYHTDNYRNTNKSDYRHYGGINERDSKQDSYDRRNDRKRDHRDDYRDNYRRDRYDSHRRQSDYSDRNYNKDRPYDRDSDNRKFRSKDENYDRGNNESSSKHKEYSRDKEYQQVKDYHKDNDRNQSHSHSIDYKAKEDNRTEALQKDDRRNYYSQSSNKKIQSSSSSDKQSSSNDDDMSISSHSSMSVEKKEVKNQTIRAKFGIEKNLLTVYSYLYDEGKKSKRRLTESIFKENNKEIKKEETTIANEAAELTDLYDNEKK